MMQLRPGPPRSLFARAVNRLAMPFGILPFSFFYGPGVPEAGNRERVFDKIYRANAWGGEESASGTGSELQRTERYRKALLHFLRRHEVTSIFDAPCGDLNWMRHVLASYPVRYVGGDIAEPALEIARTNCPGVDVTRFDICQDPFPAVEVWHCRDALFHLSFEEVWMALQNAAASTAQFALLTTHRSRWLKNLDIETGGWRFLDLERPPIQLSKPIEYLPDTDSGEFPRFVGVWTMDQIRQALVRRQAPS